LLGAVAGVSLLVDASKSAMDNAKQNEAANKDLAQAYATLKEKVPNQEIDAFIEKNQRFISSMYGAKEGFASLARAGFDNATQLRLMNDAMDLAAVKHISLNQAVEVLIKAYSGNVRGLIDLGFNQKDVNEAVGKGADKSQHYAGVLALLEPKIKGGRDATDESVQASNRLSNSWQKLSNQDGPGLQSAMNAVQIKAADMLTGFVAFSQNDQWWGNLSAGLVDIAKKLEPIVATIQWINANGLNPLVPATTTSSSSANAARTRGYRP